MVKPFMAEHSLCPWPLFSWHPFHFISQKVVKSLINWSASGTAVKYRNFSAELVKAFLLLCCWLSAALSGSWWKGPVFPGAVRQTSTLRSSEILFPPFFFVCQLWHFPICLHNLSLDCCNNINQQSWQNPNDRSESRERPRAASSMLL